MHFSSPGKRVFVVDDESVIAMTLGTIFERAGSASTSYDDPTQLLAACAIAAPDAVVSDVMMPQMTGVELALRLGQLYPACKVILMSGGAETSIILGEAWQRGHEFEVLSKPVPPPDLIEHLRAALG